MAPRLDTPLSKALLESGSLHPSALEDAVQEQLIHGGALDTILLEKGAVEERKLAALLSTAWGTEPVSLEAIEHPDPAAVKALPERMALTMKLCPFAVEGTAVHVLVASPLDRALIEEVGGLLVKPLVPHVVPEVRLWQGLQRAYGTAPDERFAALLTDLNVKPMPRMDSPSQEGAPIDDGADPGAARWDLVEALAHLAAQDSRDGIARVATSFARKFVPFAAMIGVRGADLIGWLRSGPAEGVQFLNKQFRITDDCVLDGALKSSSPSLGKPAITAGNAALFGWLGRRRPRTFLAVPVVVAGKPVGALVADGGIRAKDFQSVSELVSFAARLGPAFEALLRQRQKRALETIKDGSGIHREAGAALTASKLELPAVVDEAADRERRRRDFDIHTEVTAPMGPTKLPPFTGRGGDVPAPPPFPAAALNAPKPVTMTAMPRVELRPPERPDVPDGTSPFARNYAPHRPPPPELPRPVPVPPLVATVADLSGFSRLEAPGGPPVFAEVTDTHATEAWRGALEGAVERGHQGGTVNPEDKARIFLGEDGWEDIHYEGSDVVARAAAAISMPVLVQSVDALGTVNDGEPVTEEEPPSPLEELVDQLDALDDDAVLRAKKLVLERGVEAVPALAERFPGRLRVDPFDPGENVTTAARLGAVVDVLYALGPAGLDAAIPHLDSRYPAHRFAAVLLFALTPDERGIDLLRARLHDQEPRVRQLAADALAPFVAHPRFEAVLAHLRERLQSPLYEARRRAAQLLGAFRDVGAVPVLIALLDARGTAELAEDAHQALRAITLQDYGARARGWERWWNKAKKRSRVDWLIEGLASDDRELRREAHVELSAICGDDFGYDPDQQKKDRQRAVAVFTTWWAEEQARAKAG